MKKSSAKFFGKSLLALVLGVIAVAGLAVAGLLSYYGKVVGTATVSQSVRVNDCQIDSTHTCELPETINVVAGNSGYSGPYTIKNYATSEAPIKITCPDVIEGDKTVIDTKCVLLASETDCSSATGYGDGPITDRLASEATKYLCIQYNPVINAAKGSYEITTVVEPG
jgi:CheY-specific phosphatase CheX